MNTLMTKLSVLSITLPILISACQSAKPNSSNPQKNKPLNVVCKDPRPEMCTQEFKPVCATKDTGIRCVTSPCPSTEQITYPNACSACADSKVFRYSLEACQSK